MQTGYRIARIDAPPKPRLPDKTRIETAALTLPPMLTETVSSTRLTGAHLKYQKQVLMLTTMGALIR
jgi:hypothetical protein